MVDATPPSSSIFRTARTRAAGCALVRQRDREAHDALAAPELDDVASLERDLALLALLEGDAPLAAQDRRAVRRAEVLQEVAVAAEDDAGVLARDVLVGQDDVVPRRPAQAHDVGRRLVPRAAPEAVGHVERDHSTDV
jgi:hypothetical protein